jgi:hypothetical protein
MEDAFCRFDTVKDVFLPGRAGTKAKAKANAPRTDLVKKRKVQKYTNAETWTPYNKRRKMSDWRGYIRHKIHISKELDADFNLPKIHLMSHWV